MTANLFAKPAKPMSIKLVWWQYIPNYVAAIILIQTLFFKFTAAEESIYIFTQVGVEPVGRIGSGIVELIAAALLLWPACAYMGAFLATGTMSGAIISHLFILGIEVKGDGGELFALANVVLLSCLYILWRDRSIILATITKIRGK